LPIVRALRERRQERRRSQAWVAKQLGVSPTCVTLWENGARMMSLRRVYDYAALFDLELLLCLPGGLPLVPLESEATPTRPAAGGR
jgi:DNA-binding XRE family transcriptional regulator